MPRQWSHNLQPNVREVMQGLGKAIGEQCPAGVGFVLLMFDFGEANTGFMNYLSNAQRPDMIAALKELVHVLEGERC